MTEDSDFLQRRALVAGAAVLGAGLAAAAPAAGAQTRHAAWSPVKEKIDDWMEIPGAHRFVFDCATPEAAGAALSYARVYYVYSKSGYGLDPSSLALILILRANATPVGFNDAIWAKYGGLLGANAKLLDPETHAPPVRNIFNTKTVSAPGANGVVLSDLVQRGTQFAVCGNATTGISEFLAHATGGQASAIHAELAANLIPNAHLVPAGIIALNRAQERGYAVAHIG
jgi:intracellular sulfur oxidation DsrE/DsrF family protein